MALIELKGIKKTYGSGDNAVYALRGVDLTIEHGELVSIIGTSGSGKSTLLNFLGLLDRPEEGEYLLDGTSVIELSEDRLSELRNYKIGFVFQSFFLIPKLTSKQNVMLPLLYRNTPAGEADKRAQKMMERFEIGHLANNRPAQLSGGQQQRVALARALVGDPDIILGDEPTGALDTATSDTVIDAFRQLQREMNKTVIIVTHDTSVAERCQRVIRVSDGAIVSDELTKGAGR